MASRLRQSSSAKISFFAFQDIITAVSGILILIVLMLASGIDQEADGMPDQSNLGLQNQLAELLSEQARLEIEILSMRETLAAAHSLPDTHRISAEVDSLRDRLQQTKRRSGELEAETHRREADARQQDALLGLTDLRSTVDKLRRETVELEKQAATAAGLMRQAEEKVQQAQSKLLLAKAKEGQIWLVPDKDASTMEPVLVTVAGSGLLLERFDKPSERAVIPAPSAATGIEKQLEKLNRANQYLVFMIRPSGIDLFKDVSEAVRAKGFSIGFDAIIENQVVHFTKPNEADWISETATSNPTPQIITKPLQAGTNAAEKPAVKLPAPVVPKTEPWWRRLLHALGF